MNSITINWSAEDRARIDKLIEHLERLGVDHVVIGRENLYTPEKPTAMPEISTKPAQIDKIDQKTEIEPTELETPSTPVEEDESVEIIYDLTDVMNKVQELIQAGKKDQVKPIIQKYAPNVSSIPVEKFNEVMDKLTALSL